MSDPSTATQDHDVDQVVQRVVPFHAADGSSLRSAAASSVFNWNRTPCAPAPATEPQAEPEPDAAAPTPQPQEEKTTMAKKRAARTRAPSTGGPQMQICTALMQHGDLARDALGEACGELTTAQISSALNNAKHLGRIAWIDKDGVYRLTKAGQEWVSAAGAEAGSPE